MKTLILSALSLAVGAAFAQTDPNYGMPASKIYTNRDTMIQHRSGSGDDLIAHDDAELPAVGDPNGSGSFRINCATSHMSYDDGIVWPGSPGRTHLHVFFGNVTTNEHEVLHGARSTCKGGKINGSGYWTPGVLYDWPENPTLHGTVLNPTGNNAYYKGWPSGDAGNAAMRWPSPHMRMITGNPLNTGPAVNGRYDCLGTTTHPFDHLPTTAQVQALGPGECTELIILVNFGGCWDGNDDSPDHHSHVIGLSTNVGSNFCQDPTHPYLIPSISFNIHYKIPDISHWDHLRLSSDQPKATAVGACATSASNYCAGASLHGDWWSGWDPTTLFFGKLVQDHILDQCLRSPTVLPGGTAKNRDCHDENLGYINPAQPTWNYRLK